MKLICIPFMMCAQNSVSLSTGTVALEFVTPSEAGNPVMLVTDNSKWLNYSMTVTPPETAYSIEVQLESVLPDGLQMQILAGPYQGTWGGSVAAPNRRGSDYTDNPAGDSPGIAASVVTLSLLPQVLISQIGTFDTGIGAYVGHQLTYTLSISDYSKVRAASESVTVRYTITQSH